MHWDFFTVMSVASGVVLVLASLGGEVVGPPSERAGLFGVGAASIAYGAWVATQTTGFYFFSVAPAGLAVLIIVKAVQCSADATRPAANRPGPVVTTGGIAAPGNAIVGDIPPRPTPLQEAQPLALRNAVHNASETFAPAFAILQSRQDRTYRYSAIDLGWDLGVGPQLAEGEQPFGAWRGHARLKVAADASGAPSGAINGVRWVTAFDGDGRVVSTDRGVVGIVSVGDSVLGAVDHDGQRVVIWRLAASACASCETQTDGSILVTASSPASRLVLSGLEPEKAGGEDLSTLLGRLATS